MKALSKVISVALGAALLSLPVLAAQEVKGGIAALEEEVLRQLNQARLDLGLPPLLRDLTLDAIARRHSEELAARGIVSHHSNLFGLSTERRLRISFPDLAKLGENVARNRTVDRLHEALMNSPGHRANRFDSDFTHVGIGLAPAGPYHLYLTEVFVRPQSGSDLGEPIALYFEADPGAYARREEPRVVLGEQVFTVTGRPDPDDPEHWTELGIRAFNAGNLEEAELDFRQALALEPTYSDARFNLSRVLMRRSNPEEAAQILDDYLSRYPADLEARKLRAAAALLLQDYTTAEEELRTVLEIERRDAGTWYNLGLALEYQDRPREAESAYVQALHLDPSLHAARAGLARVKG